jgi:hypothetical protein
MYQTGISSQMLGLTVNPSLDKLKKKFKFHQKMKSFATIAPFFRVEKQQLDFCRKQTDHLVVTTVPGYKTFYLTN